jgi:RecB family exonuclease
MDPKVIGALSPTKLEQARLCEARLAGKLEAIASEEEWDEDRGEGASMGTLAHDAAKIWYRPNEVWQKRVRSGEDSRVLAKQAEEIRQKYSAGDPPDPSAGREAMEAWQEQDEEGQHLADVEIAKLGLLKHPLRNPDKVFRMALAECAKGQFGNELPKEASSVEEGRAMFDAIINHYKRDALNIVFAERRYKGKIGAQVPIHLIIDLAVDRGDGRLEIIDFKTGFLTCTTEEMHDKDQVKMNLLAVVHYDNTLTHFHNKSFTYFWVRSGYETGPVSFTKERLTDYEHYLASVYQHLLTVENPKPSFNRFCTSCPKRFGCSKFQEVISEAMGMSEVITDEQLKALESDPEEIMARYDRLRAQEKLIEESKKKTGEFLRKMIEKQGKKVMEGDAFKASIRQNKADSYDTATVLSLCTTHKVDPTTVVSVGKKKVDEAFGTNPDAMRMLGLNMRRGATQPFVDVRQIKKQEPKVKARKAKE